MKKGVSAETPVDLYPKPWIKKLEKEAPGLRIQMHI